MFNLQVAHDILNSKPDRPVSLFGAPSFDSPDKLEQYIAVLHDAGWEILEFLDNDTAKHGSKIAGLPILAPTESTTKNKLILISSVAAYHPISIQLTEFGLTEEIDFRSLYVPLFPEKLCGSWPTFAPEEIPDVELKFLQRESCLRGMWKHVHLWIPEKLYDTPRRFIDIGCGNGALLYVLKHLGHSVIGLDYTPGMEPHTHRYRTLSELFGLTVLVHDGSNLPYPFYDNAFDVLVSTLAINKISEPTGWGRILDEFQRITKECLLVTFPPHGPEYKDQLNVLHSWKSQSNNMVSSSPSTFKFTLQEV